jgi:hypothetical protein
MEMFLKTPVAAQQLKVTYNQLINLIRYRRIPPPRKDSSGDYLWSEEDLAIAVQAMANREQRTGRPR